MSIAFGSGPSNGHFWFGGSSFPGFLYKKNVGVGGRRSTKMNPGGNITCNKSTYLYNKYTPGSGGIGASSTSNRRAKNRLATVCRSGDGSNTKNCFPCQPTLGQYSKYTHNPNGYYSCISPPPTIDLTPPPPPPPPLPCCSLVDGNIEANMDTTGMLLIPFAFPDDDYAYLPFIEMDFYFFGINYGNSDGSPGTQDRSIYMNTNNGFGFGYGQFFSNLWPETSPGIVFDFFDSLNIESFVSEGPQNGENSNAKYIRIVFTGTGYFDSDYPTDVKKAYEIYYVRDNCFQYMQFNCNEETVTNRSGYNNFNDGFGNISNITNGTAFQNTFGAFGDQPSDNEGPQTGGSYVIRSDLNGENWTFFPNTHLIL